MSNNYSIGPWVYYVGAIVCKESNAINLLYHGVNREVAYYLFEANEIEIAPFYQRRKCLYISPLAPVCERAITINGCVFKIGLFRTKLFYYPNICKNFISVLYDVVNNEIIPLRIRWKQFMRNEFTSKLMERMFHPKNMDKFEGWGFDVDELL